MDERRAIIIGTLERKLRLARKNDVHEMFITLDVVMEILEQLKQQEEIIRTLHDNVDYYYDMAKKRIPVVRCEECKHGEPGACGDGIDCDGVWHDADWFCADGERK